MYLLLLVSRLLFLSPLLWCNVFLYGLSVYILYTPHTLGMLYSLSKFWWSWCFCVLCPCLLKFFL